MTLVVAAGNDPIPVSRAKTEASLNKNIIVVASLRKDGSPSKFTSYGDAVTVSAPSNYSLRTYDFEGNAVDFMGTSGATPLVTGTVGGFTYLSRHHLTTRQADLLLKKTATPLPYLPSNHSLGAGMLNAYKIGMVAFRIKEGCQQYSTESQRDQCLSDLLENEDTYRFNETSTQLFDEAMESFPECLSPRRISEGRINDCERTEAFNNLRRAFLLNPTDAKTLNAVICVKEEHFEGEGVAFYRSLAESLQKGDDEIIADICRNERKAHLITYLSRPMILNALHHIKQCSSAKFAEFAFTSLPNLPFFEESKKLILAHPGLEQRTLRAFSRSIANNAEQFSNPQELLEKILTHPNASSLVLGTLTKSVADNAEKLPNPQELLEKIFANPKNGGIVLGALSRAIIDNAEKLPNPQALLEKILTHPNINEIVLEVLYEKLQSNIRYRPLRMKVRRQLREQFNKR